MADGPTVVFGPTVNGRRSEILDNGTSYNDSGYEIKDDAVLEHPGLDFDIPIGDGGKMMSYEYPSYECKLWSEDQSFYYWGLGLLACTIIVLAARRRG